MLSWLKGKKPQQVAKLVHPGPDDDGVARIISKKTFTGPSGEMLRRIGAGPDDPSNLVLTQDLLNARLERRREQQAAFLSSWNSQLPKPCKIIPWAMIPWSVWSGDHGEFLFKQDLYPVDAWNTMLLPADEHTELVLGLPRHLQAVPQKLEEHANRYLEEIIGKVVLAHQETMKSFQTSGTAEFGAFSDVVDRAKHEIRVVAHHLAATLYGDSAYHRHQKLFGASLGMREPAEAE